MMIRRNPKASDGWNHGDLDVAFQLFQYGMVWDGNIASKLSRNHLIEQGYAIRRSGFTALTPRGVLRFVMTPRVWLAVYRRWRLWKQNPLAPRAARVE